MKQKRSRASMVSIATAVLFLAVLGVILFATTGLSDGADEEGVAATRSAIERAAVLCYASEGFYPPGLTYIEENYGVQIDRSRYIVRYEIFSDSIQPVVDVLRILK